MIVKEQTGEATEAKLTKRNPRKRKTSKRNPRQEALHVSRLVDPNQRYLTIRYHVEFWIALALAIAVSPIVALALLIVRLTSRGPAIYRQTRSGLNGRLFTIYKIRSMRFNCEARTGPQWSTPGDPRITFIGKFLRSSHIDELPQLLNVLRGDMSLLGPRPERPEIVDKLRNVFPHYEQRHLVRPGITGLAQVHLPPDSDLNSVRLKLIYDFYYLNHLSPLMDLRILLCTTVKFMGMPFRYLRSRLFRNAINDEHLQKIEEDVCLNPIAPRTARLKQAA